MTEIEIAEKWGAVVSGHRLAMLLGWRSHKSLRAAYARGSLDDLPLLDLEGRQGLAMTATAIACYLDKLDRMGQEVLRQANHEDMRVRPQAVKKPVTRVGRQTASGAAIRAIVG